MMNGTDLLERRAERGSARGAAKVWANAQLSPHDGRGPEHRSRLLFRIALVVWIVGLIAVALDQANDDSPTDTVDQPDTTEPVSADDEALLPEPILIDGMKLDGASIPFSYSTADSEGAVEGAVEDFFDGLFGSNRDRAVINDADERGTSTVIFADPERPFEEPILGLLLFGSGGFRPWGVNVEPGQLEELSAHVAQQDGDWRIDEDSGLVEVARFDDDPWDMVRYGWQFDFVDGDDQATLQAESHDAFAEWIWLSRLGSGEVDSGRNLFVTPTTVLGNDALVLSIEGTDRRDPDFADSRTELLWTSDDFAYRLVSSSVRDNTAFGRAPDEDVDNLTLVERQVWLDSIDRANRTPIIEWVGGLLSITLMLALIVSSVVLLFRRSYRSAAIAFATVLVWIVVLGSFGFSQLLVLTAGLGLAWWSRRTRARGPIGEI